MKAPRLPIAIQQAVMRSLREKLAQANLKLGRNYPEPKLVYQQRGTAAGTAWLESYEIRLNPVLMRFSIISTGFRRISYDSSQAVPAAVPRC